VAHIEQFLREQDAAPAGAGNNRTHISRPAHTGAWIDLQQCAGLGRLGYLLPGKGQFINRP